MFAVEHPLADSTQKPNVEPIIVFRYGQTNSYAIGIAREGIHDGELKNDQRHKSTNRQDTNNSGLTSANSKLDHCCSLLKKDKKGAWNVENCLSAVELTMSDTNQCSVFSSSDEEIEASLFLESHHESMA
jgi:hypothetical protein